VYCASVRIKELLDDFLNRHRRTNGEPGPCDLRELVTGAVSRIAVLAESQSIDVVHCVPENLLVAVDRQRIQRVLINLLVNSVEVMPQGGAIRISADAGSHSVLVKVRDTGPGIAPEIRHRLFEPFVSAKAEGLGLGLACSRQAVMEHGGEMWVEFGGPGACFAFTLPRYANTRFWEAAASSDALSGS
jgi:signal transduction histidine kinase